MQVAEHYMATLLCRKWGYTLCLVLSSSGHHSDGVACVTLEVSESDLSCCWVTELQGGLTTSLRMVGHMGGVETVGSWA